MTPTFAPLAGKNAAVTLEELLPQVLSAPPRQAHYLMVSTLYRRIAIAGLLSTADPGTFFQNLFKSGRAFLHFLQSAPDAEKTTSKSEPLFDAIACRDRQGAAALAKNSRRTFASGKEYEEDFFYIRFLMDRFIAGTSEGSPQQWLDSWGALAPDDFRLAVCTALDQRDQSAFDKAIETAISELRARIETLRVKDALSADDAATTARVSTEVLAWLEFAEAAGLAVERDYPLAPSLARQFQEVRLPDPDAWRTVEVLRAFERAPVRPHARGHLATAWESIREVVPATSIGDVGAASGALGVCIAARSWARGYALTNQALVCNTSDSGVVGVIALGAP